MTMMETKTATTPVFKLEAHVKWIFCIAVQAESSHLSSECDSECQKKKKRARLNNERGTDFCGSESDFISGVESDQLQLDPRCPRKPTRRQKTGSSRLASFNPERQSRPCSG